ncbi:MAG: lytic murein transglycosylase [Alphaproteobacteria bacterium]
MAMRLGLRGLATVACLAGGLLVGAGAETTAAAEPQTQSFEAWLQDLRTEAAGRGITAKTLDATLTGVQPIPKVLDLDRRQPEFKLSFEKYMATAASPARMDKGRRLMATHKALLEAVGRKYGVQPRFIVALWGIETDFGRVTGGFPVIPALATLAYDGRRSKYFRQELMDALLIVDQGHIAADRMIGSWAGAMGQSQFMPSSFLKFAEDYDGDGRRDIWGTRADVFASAANYLAKSGWNADETWGRAVRLPKGFDTSLATFDVHKSLEEWSRLGVRAADGRPLPKKAIRAALVLAQPGGPAFLVYGNFETVLKWNRSNLFALAVGHLADAFAHR